MQRIVHLGLVMKRYECWVLFAYWLLVEGIIARIAAVSPLSHVNLAFNIGQGLHGWFFTDWWWVFYLVDEFCKLAFTVEILVEKVVSGIRIYCLKFFIYAFDAAEVWPELFLGATAS
jgi:hypothetical protein